jgi:hypothetical protein
MSPFPSNLGALPLEVRYLAGWRAAIQGSEKEPRLSLLIRDLYHDFAAVG